MGSMAAARRAGYRADNIAIEPRTASASIPVCHVGKSPAKKSGIGRRSTRAHNPKAMISGGIGLVIAFGLCALVDLLPMPDFFAGLLPTWQTGTLALAVLGSIAILSALYPARRAAAIDPIEALRHEAGG